jgi:thiol-disulfide isomerase/thioredoxin
MPYLVAAVVLVGAVTVLNLLLSYGVIRRLRQHSDLLSGRDAPSLTAALMPGEQVGEFQTRTIDGQEITEAALTAGTVVAFFTPNCGPCKERLPQFAEFAGRDGGHRDRFLAVLVGEEADVEEGARQLAPVSRVVRTDRGSPLVKAFGVVGYPSIVTLDADRRVAASGTDLSVLAVGV